MRAGPSLLRAVRRSISMSPSVRASSWSSLRGSWRQAIAREGAGWVQIDEPCLVVDLDESSKTAFRLAYERLSRVAGAPRTLLATYFGALGANLELATSL